MKRWFLLLILIVSACGKESAKKSSESYQNVSPIYASRKLNINVYYEKGAEPYTDQIPLVEKGIWYLLETNLNALLQGRAIDINVPSKLSDMTELPSSKKTSWSLEDVLSLAKAQARSDEKGTTDFQIFFLNGYAEEGPGIIGFHISNTNIMAIFKDVIRYSSTGSTLEIVPRYVEQATLIHEMGHALGLVNNGLPMQENHQDKEHGAHCSNPDCVMYYSNEGTASMVKFVTQAYKNGSTTMFDSLCLEDARKFKK